jgi:hypothetical protein
MSTVAQVVEFVGFDETPLEKYLGVATIRILNEVILRFKVQRTKDGNGIFIAAPSFKKTNETGEHWCQWHMLDSMSQNEVVTNLIKSKVKEYYQIKSGNMQASNSGIARTNQNSPNNQTYNNTQKSQPASSNGWSQNSWGVATA